MTSETGLRRFVRPPAGSRPDKPASMAPVLPPAAARGPADAVGQELPVPGLAGGMKASQETAGLPEKCELCAAMVPAEHGHIADLEAASLLCACRACYLLFTQRSAGRGRYRAVPDRYLSDPARVISPPEWDELEIPVGLAFFLRSSRAGGALTGFYPSPAGATECRLDLRRWEQLVARYPLLGAPEPDVEAALISRSGVGVECFLVPVDACYELAGRMRLHWRGFDGGAEARQSIGDFLAMVRSRAGQFSPQDGVDD